MKIETVRFGPIDIEEEAIIHFPLGLLGFETRQRYVLVDDPEASPMRWLQSLEEPALAFLIVEPGMLFPDYVVAISDDDQAFLVLSGTSTDASVDGGPVVACLVAIPDDPQQMTINLMGPLVINLQKRLGKQVVMHDGGYSARHRLIPDPSGASEETTALV